LLVVPFAVDRWRAGDRRGAFRLIGWAVGAWLLVNLPVALARPSRWWVFYRFNRLRMPDVDALWSLGCRATGSALCTNAAAVNLGASVLFVAGVALAWWLRSNRNPAFARWTLAFPIVALFVLTSKVYSPQYSLWLVPWFALVLPDLRLFVAFSAADVAVAVSRFGWFATEHGLARTPYWMFALAVAVRAGVLVWCLVAWTRGEAAERIPVVEPARTSPRSEGWRAAAGAR
jgi:uncharacterized membrane protein